MSVLIKGIEMPKNCEKCRWYKRTYPVYTFGEFSARCLLGGCDESRYVPRDGKDEGIMTYLARPNCGADMREGK